MLAIMQLDTLPDAPGQAHLAQRLTAMPGVVDALLTPTDRAIHVDYDPIRTNDEAIASAIRSFGLAVVSMGTAPDDLIGHLA